MGQWLPGFSLSQAVWGSRSEGEICASFVPLVAFNHFVSRFLVEFFRPRLGWLVLVLSNC